MMQHDYQKQQNIFQIQDMEVVTKSKSRHLIIMNHLKKKEDNWNNRFYVNQHEDVTIKFKQPDQISEFINPRSVKKQLSQDRLRQNQEEEFTPQIIQKQGRPNINQRLKLGVPPISSINDTERELLIRSLQTLKDLWTKFNIPNHHRDVFIQCMKAVSKSKALTAMNQESEDLLSNKAYIQNCIVAIQSRENCLLKLNQILENLSDGVLDIQIGVQQCSELITHLRILTINVVEQIVAWRQYFLNYLMHIQSYSSILIPFMFKEENYLMKIKRDTGHLASSQISNQFTFSNRSDPFFLALTNIQASNQKTNDKIVQFTSKPLIKRIKVCELILISETTTEVNSDKSIQIKKVKSNEQQKQVQSPQRQLNIQPGKIRRTRDTSNHNNYQQANVSASQAQDSYLHLQGIINKSGVVRKMQPNSEEQDRINYQTPLNKINSSSKKSISVNQDQEEIRKQNSEKIASKEVNQQINKIQPSSIVVIEEQQIQQELNIHKYEIELIEVQGSDLRKVSEFIREVQDAYKQTFVSDLAQISKSHTQGMDSFFLGVNDINKSQTGLAFFYMDKQCFNERRFFLSHYSVRLAINFSPVLKQVLEYFWENVSDPASELRICLYHYQQNDYYGANKEITSQLKDIGFKWKIVQQVNPDVRVTVMALRRPGQSNKVSGVEPIFLQNVIAQCNHPVENQQNSFTSPIVTACLISKLDYNISNDSLNLYSQAKEDLLSKQYDFKGIKYDSQNGEELNIYLKQNFETSDDYHSSFLKSWSDEQNQIQYAFLKACYRWKHSKLGIIKETDYLYTKLQNFDTDQDGGSVFQLQSKEKIVYLITTDDPAINIFIYEVQSNIAQEQFLQSIQLTLQDLESQIPIDQELFLPQFIVNTQIHYQCQNQDRGLVKIGRFSTHYAPKLNTPGQYDRSMGIVLKPPYVFGVLNSDVTELVNLPYLAFIVEDKDCIRKATN